MEPLVKTLDSQWKLVIGHKYGYYESSYGWYLTHRCEPLINDLRIGEFHALHLVPDFPMRCDDCRAPLKLDSYLRLLFYMEHHKVNLGPYYSDLKRIESGKAVRYSL
jgi:hypothetical protein